MHDGLIDAAKFRLIFVCSGNICRSPTAEGIARALAAERGWASRLHIDSAGTHGLHSGQAPDPRTIAVAQGYGVDLTDRRARRIECDDFERFDLILAMDRGHVRELRAICPERHAHKLRLLLDYAPGLEQRDVPDPYYGDDGGFIATFRLIRAGTEALFEALAAEIFAAE